MVYRLHCYRDSEGFPPELPNLGICQDRLRFMIFMIAVDNSVLAKALVQ